MKISFIIVEFHSVEDIIECYLSIAAATPQGWNYEIIISSNSVYSQEEKESLIFRNRDLKWVFNEKNGGFAYAMNKGLINAEGDVLVIMNPDVRIKNGIDKMINYLLLDSSIGLIAPQIRNVNGMVQDSFREFITPLKFAKRHIYRLFKRDKFSNPKSPVNVDWVIGAFMMMPRKAYEAVEGLDDNYFLYCEDMDLCKRMYIKGYSVVYYPDALIEYEGTRSARVNFKYSSIFVKSLFLYWSKFGKSYK